MGDEFTPADIAKMAWDEALTHFASKQLIKKRRKLKMH